MLQVSGEVLPKNRMQEAWPNLNPEFKLFTTSQVGKIKQMQVYNWLIERAR